MFNETFFISYKSSFHSFTRSRILVVLLTSHWIHNNRYEEQGIIKSNGGGSEGGNDSVVQTLGRAPQEWLQTVLQKGPVCGGSSPQAPTAPLQVILFFRLFVA